MPSFQDLLGGIVVETETQTFLGCCYSDREYQPPDPEMWTQSYYPQPLLNQWAEIPVIGIAAGVMRMALAVIHTIAHLFAALVTLNKGHCFHAAKGGCEFLRGFIEAIPFVGRWFAKDDYDWWIIKIYNPDRPDRLDYHRGRWESFRQTRPSAYVVAYRQTRPSACVVA